MTQPTNQPTLLMSTNHHRDKLYTPPRAQLLSSSADKDSLAAAVSLRDCFLLLIAYVVYFSSRKKMSARLSFGCGAVSSWAGLDDDDRMSRSRLNLHASGCCCCCCGGMVGRCNDAQTVFARSMRDWAFGKKRKEDSNLIFWVHLEIYI